MYSILMSLTPHAWYAESVCAQIPVAVHYYTVVGVLVLIKIYKNSTFL